jgi:hypothetical protein
LFEKISKEIKMRGGHRANAGRPKGRTNKRTETREAVVLEMKRALESGIPGAFEGDSHALLMSIYKNPALDIDLRLDAAKAAIPYEKPRLAAVDVKAEIDATVAVSQIELVAPPIEHAAHAAH